VFVHSHHRCARRGRAGLENRRILDFGLGLTAHLVEDFSVCFLSLF
jgi:hypothetical protein